MKRLVTVGPWRVLADAEATRAAHERYRHERCRCSYCRNFEVARVQTYPAAFITLLDQFGIDRTREIEVYEMGRVAGGRRCYGGWFYLIGHLCEPNEGVDQYELTPGFEIRMQSGPSYPVSGFDVEATLELAFTTNVPWVLDEPEPP